MRKRVRGMRLGSEKVVGLRSWEKRSCDMNGWRNEG